jgi:hypothetical protein
MQARKIYVDLTSRSVSQGAPGLTGSVFAAFQEDVEAIELYFSKTENGVTTFEDYSGESVKLAVGVTSPAAIITAWTALTSSVSATITTLQAATAGVNEIQRVTLTPVPETGTFAINFPSRSITISSITASTCLATNHGLFNGQTVSITGFTGISGFSNGDSFFVRDRTTGSFRLGLTPIGTASAITATSGGTATLEAIVTPPIAAKAQPADVQSAIAASGLTLGGQSQVAVSGQRGQYTLSYQGVLSGIDYPQITVVNNTLSAAPGLSANLSFNTSEVASIISEGSGQNCKLEIEVSDGTRKQTYQTAATISDDIISSGSSDPLSPAMASGFRLMSPNGTVFEISADNNGLLQSVLSASTSAPSGLALISANGTTYTLSVANDGTLATSTI